MRRAQAAAAQGAALGRKAGVGLVGNALDTAAQVAGTTAGSKTETAVQDARR